MAKNMKHVELNIIIATARWFKRIQVLVLQQKLLTQVWRKIKEMVF